MEYTIELEKASGDTDYVDEIFKTFEAAEEKAFELNQKKRGKYIAYLIRGLF